MFRKIKVSKSGILFVIALVAMLNAEEIGPLIINEIYPFSGKYGEWLEIKNRSTARINLKGWQISDPQKSSVLTYKDFFIDSGEVVLILKDELLLKGSTVKTLTPQSWISLNNDEDSLKLILPYSELISDEVYYSYKWFENDASSLQRVSNSRFGLTKEMWQSSSVSPGYELTFHSNVGNSLYVTPLVITPNNDGIDDFLRISAIGKDEMPVKIMIFNFNGIQEFEKSLLSGENFNWNGKNETGEYIEKGPLFIVAQFKDGNTIKKRVLLWR